MKSYKLSIRIKTSKFGEVETEAVEISLDGAFIIDRVVVYEKVDEGTYLFKETLPIKHEQ